jgi:glycosyltransferase involved in cell wall biosynthesis
MQYPTVVVGIATHNRAGLLRKAISSALDQSYRPLRIAIVDDGSSDHTPALRDEFAELSWERWEQAQGYVKARNQMMLSASEDYFVSLDDDAWFIDGNEIAIAIEFMECRPSVAAVGFDVLAKWRPDKRERGLPGHARNFIGCGHVLRLSVVKQLGGYAEFPGRYGCEEKDICLRIIDAGYEIAVLPGVHVWHDYSPEGRNADQYLAGLHNDLAMVLWRVPLPVLLPALIWRVQQQFRHARRINCAHVLPKVIFDFARAIPRLWRDRQPVRISSIARYWALPPPF